MSGVEPDAVRARIGTGVRAVEEADLGAARALLHAVFRTDPVSRWIFPEEEHREARHPELFGAFLACAHAYGTAEMTDDGEALALWFDVRDGALRGGGELAAALGHVDPGNARLSALGEATDEGHPHEDHAYLQAIAVTPGRQCRGIGGALLRHRLAVCDRQGLPAYLEASSPRSRSLYERHGFAVRGSGIQLPADGPVMWPMWRDPGG
ncbi:GNAT family N-acetyltransferase [Streptomyces tubbatahanensis]|uniref:GNAT family N-acetyltransferase n=1 Tax=Streptomyces tubbatahanensis TaxID=2923272 RepID=A0ABY3XWU6_9ACTN|nr:GNAT family N-acetyltransferase [Streptomyces tubbatahanensis]UNS98902.1 GNAT family N-acetyltransferase [Streptomyces tubbatahanensis]